MSHFKAKMHQIPFLVTARLSVQKEFATMAGQLRLLLGNGYLGHLARHVTTRHAI